MRYWLCVALLVASLAGALAPRAGRAAPLEDDAFARAWARVDAPVADGATQRTWLWGPAAYSSAFLEPYAEAPGGMRRVQYFDKSRMELTDPNADPNADWYVTNGLLVVELTTGRLQLGDDTFEQHDPASINVAGDPDDPNGPTYATFGALRDARPVADGAPLDTRLARDGTLTVDAALDARGATAAQLVSVPGIAHQVASPFWAFMTSSGLVQDGAQALNAPLFSNPFYATGYPISEAYWTTVRVGGVERDVLAQCFERRCLTWTPDNPIGWQVEAGNVGQHYYAWRYGADPQPYADRAAAAYAAMQNCFYDAGAALYADSCPNVGPNPYAYAWPFAQAFAATETLAAVPGAPADVAARLAGANQYWDANASPPGYFSYIGSGDKYYDDNAWLGLALVRAYRLTGNSGALDRARQVFDFNMSGWDTNAAHPDPGGIYWTQADWNDDRNTVSTAPTAELALALAQLTPDAGLRDQYVATARTLLGWVDANLRDADGLYWDHIALDGTIEKTKWSYNQGTMLGAYVLLYQVTGDAGALGRAEQIANAALAFYAGPALDNQPPPFNAIFFRNLMLLDSAAPNPNYRAALRGYAERFWDGRRDPNSNLVTVTNPPVLLDQAALVEVNALLAANPTLLGP